jgi:mannosyltransferase
LQGNTLALSVGYLLSTTLLIYTHIYGLFVVIAQNLFLVILALLSKNHPYSLKSWAKLQAIVVAFFIPWIAVLIKQIPQRETAISSLPSPTTQMLIDTFHAYSGTGALMLLFLGFSVLSLFAWQKCKAQWIGKRH